MLPRIWGFLKGRFTERSNSMRSSKISVFLWCIIACVSMQCGSVQYSFTGASLGPEVKTIAIDNFYNDAGGGPANLSQQFTEEIKDYYTRNTSLAVVSANGDLQLEGSIVGYQFSPVAPQASGTDQRSDQAGLMRLTITVKASYVNTYDDTFDFNNKTFSFYEDFPADQDPSTQEERLINTIFEQIIFDIFNATVANW